MAEVAIDKLNSPKSALASKAARTGVCVGFSHRFNASFGWRQEQETKIVQLVSFEEKNVSWGIRKKLKMRSSREMKPLRSIVKLKFINSNRFGCFNQWAFLIRCNQLWNAPVELQHSSRNFGRRKVTRPNTRRPQSHAKAFFSLRNFREQTS